MSFQLNLLDFSLNIHVFLLQLTKDLFKRPEKQFEKLKIRKRWKILILEDECDSYPFFQLSYEVRH